MTSNQPFQLSSLKSPAADVGVERQTRSSNGSSNVEHLSAGTASRLPEPMRTEDGFIGHLDVYVHHAREIQNICIYHKQDVYARVSLTSDPDTTLSTQTINGGGRNPVFNENLRLNVRTVESALRCEIWMLSRVKNYLKDQLLGISLIPLSDVVIATEGKLEREFQLSSTDLFHSPSGFVQLSLSYVGSSPEVMTISTPISSAAITDTILPDAENVESAPSEYEKIEFPDLHVVKENKMMLSEYIGIPCDNLDAECSDNLVVTAENDDYPDTDAGVRIVESFSMGSVDTVKLDHDTPQSEVSVNGSPEISSAISLSLSEPSSVTHLTNLDQNADTADGEVDSSTIHSNVSVPPVIKINVEPEQTVVQQDIVDLYMKSMQQFTESLAKMKLPMDIENNSSSSLGNSKSNSEQKVQEPKGNGGKVFYGSRAFF